MKRIKVSRPDFRHFRSLNYGGECVTRKDSRKSWNSGGTQAQACECGEYIIDWAHKEAAPT